MLFINRNIKFISLSIKQQLEILNLLLRFMIYNADNLSII